MAFEKQDDDFKIKFLEIQKENIELLAEKRVREQVDKLLEEKVGDLRKFASEIVQEEASKLADPSKDIFSRK